MNGNITTRTILFLVPFLVLVDPRVSLPQEIDSSFVPVTDAMLNDPAPSDWLTWRRTLSGWGYSPLDEIGRGNVAALRMVWTRPLQAGIQEGTPVVYEGVMYFPSPGDVIQALDAANGELIWEYVRPLPPDLGEYGSLVHITRNIAIYGRTLIDASTDGHLFAVDAQTGELVWETQIADFREHFRQHSSGPIIASGRVFAGANCQPRGGPEACMITAHDAETGEELWRTYTIPRPGEPGYESWGDVPYEGRWHVGTWMPPSYDPGLDRLYIGTSVTAPAPKYMLAGADERYLYHNSTLALDGATGQIVWYYQHNVDHWDLDHPFERMLVDTAVAPDPDAVEWINPNIRAGETRSVVTGIPGKTGIVYTLDRETGEFLWATPTVEQNVIAGIDPATGAVSVEPGQIYTGAEQSRFICPSMTGGKNWPAGAYSPETNTMYMPLQNSCMNAASTVEEPDPSLLYTLDWDFEITPGTENLGVIQAIAADTGETRWTYEQRAGTMSLVATGGGLVFGGDTNGYFRAFDQASGEVLWEVNIGSEVTGYPIAYAVHGKQYVAVSTGTSSLTGRLTDLTPELNPGTANNLFVFALPD